MGIRIFNTLTGKKEIFRPINKGKVRIYVCGPTVYDEPHIGHLRSAYIFEVIRRYLIFRGYKVKFVKNITDVDDKIIEKAKEEIKSLSTNPQPPVDLKSKVREVAERYLKKYHEAMEVFGITPPDVEPKVTEHIPEILKIIEGLIKKGFAYEKEGDVYFRVKRFSRYGKLSNQSTEELITGARVEPDDKKEDPLDFALWKKAKEDEPSWQTPWGEGRPGWHIECSAMSMRYLGKNFDVHGGGKDLIFPHHENEIAQAEVYTRKRFANYWIHNGLLTINGEKMAKSLGNFISADEIFKRYHPEVLKLFFLSAHYSHPIDFSDKKMDEAKRARERFYILLRKIDESIPFNAHQSPVKKKKSATAVDRFRKEFVSAMDDDFNTCRALAVLFEMVNFANKSLDKKSILIEVKRLLLDLGKIFGLFERQEREEVLESLMKLIIYIRQALRERKDYTLADKIRKDLKEIGIILEDDAKNTSWRFEA
ncbi:MAG: cysteine--tRNA ligase [Candidatus Omnitrophica bacterium]|nr:cysteine--tRNA ligase [Candidatus Omnitrophota bacterium]